MQDACWLSSAGRAYNEVLAVPFLEGLKELQALAVGVHSHIARSRLGGLVCLHA